MSRLPVEVNIVHQSKLDNDGQESEELGQPEAEDGEESTGDEEVGLGVEDYKGVLLQGRNVEVFLQNFVLELIDGLVDVSVESVNVGQGANAESDQAEAEEESEEHME